MALARNRGCGSTIDLVGRQMVRSREVKSVLRSCGHARLSLAVCVSFAGRHAAGRRRRHAQVAEESQQTEAAQLEATADAAVASS